jgi:tetrahydromethanopterin S-methyltransferase subunit C
MERIVNALLLGGLIALSGGIMLWILGLLRTYEVSPEVELAVIGVFLMILGYIIAKLFSRN